MLDLSSAAAVTPSIACRVGIRRIAGSPFGTEHLSCAGVVPVGTRCRGGTVMPIATRRNGIAPDLLSLDEIDLGSWEFWTLPGDVRDAAFATLRAKAPISRQHSP